MSLQHEIRRKTFHLVSNAIPIGYMLMNRTIALWAIAILLSFSIILELSRLFSPKLRKLIHPIFKPIMRDSEEKKISAATYLLIGAWITIYFFEKDIAVASLFLVSIGDTVAAIIGTAYGKTKFLGKSIEGTAAFFVSSGIIMIPMTGLTLDQKLAGMFAGTFSELLPIRISDNLTIPIVTAAVMQFLAT